VTGQRFQNFFVATQPSSGHRVLGAGKHRPGRSGGLGY